MVRHEFQQPGLKDVGAEDHVDVVAVAQQAGILAQPRLIPAVKWNLAPIGPQGMRIDEDVEAVPGLAHRMEGGIVIHMALQQRKMNLVPHRLKTPAEGADGRLVSVILRMRRERAEVEDVQLSRVFLRPVP